MYPLSTRRTVPAHIQLPDYASDGLPRSELAARGSNTIDVLSAQDQDKMRRVCRIGREVLDAAKAAVRIGVTTDEIGISFTFKDTPSNQRKRAMLKERASDRVVHEETIKRNAYPSPLNYQLFPNSCCVSVNEVICHGIPDQYQLKDGDLVNIDVSCYFDGFHADLNETCLVGKVDDAGVRLVDETRQALKNAIEMGTFSFLFLPIPTKKGGR